MWGWKPEKKKEKWKNCTLRKIEQNNLKIWQVEKQKKKVEKSWDLTNWMKWKTIVSNKNLREKLRFKVVCLDIPITFKPTKKT